MDSLLLYLLKISGGTTALYLLYLLFFRKDTFYQRNRIFLISALILPAFYPAIKIPVVINSVVPALPATSPENINFSAGSIVTQLYDATAPFNYNKLFLWIYFSIAALFFLRIVISLLSTYSIIRRGDYINNRYPKIIISHDQLPPFSFFPYAVIPEEDYKKGNYSAILDHEFAHIKQGHTFDLLLSELFIVIQWFNPFVWLIKHSVILNHEYLADRVSVGNAKSIKDYQYRLLNLKTGLKNISLAHNFNSLIKNRIIMINKKPTQRSATLKNLFILPVVAIGIYAFATPEYHSVAVLSDPLTIYMAAGLQQKEVKGIILKEDGKPLTGVSIMSTGTMGNAKMVTSGDDGRFSINNVQADASLMLHCTGYKGLTVKPDFTKEMSIKMEKDPDYKPEPQTNVSANTEQEPRLLVVIDGVPTDKRVDKAIQDLGYDMGIVKELRGKEATDKYGEKANNGVYEILTRKKALEMGLKPNFRRLAPGDYPTFQNMRYVMFAEWVAGQAKYPPEAKMKNSEGWVSVNFVVELDGTISNVVAAPGTTDPILVNEIIRAIQSSPKWDKPKNPAVDEPFSTGITLKFKLPDQILNDEAFVVVEEMPMYPGGDAELLKYLSANTKYPETAKAANKQGRVIIRFIVTPEGRAEGITVLKGVDPQLDNEAVRVVSTLSGFKPGMQNGKAVNVYYMVPITFNIPKPEPSK